jgi:multicomponent Na+:H+ antiporter subunit G
MVLIGFGLFFFFVGTVGVLRFPDALTRAHGAAKCDTLGAVLSILGLILQAGPTVAALKLVLVIMFLWTANPTATHMIAKAIYRNRHQEE